MTDTVPGHEAGGWEDLRFPAQGINPPGAASDPDVDTATGLLLFRGVTGAEIVAGVAQMPHGWKEGSILYPHVHWHKTTSAAGDVMWQLEYEVHNLDGTFAGAYGTAISSNVPDLDTKDDDTAGQNIVTTMGTIDMTGKTISALIFWKLSRLPLDAGDTYEADARLVELDLHYLLNSFGSVDIDEKEYTSS